MQITYSNIDAFPSSIKRAITQDNYSMGDADISVTKLIDAPQIRHLREIHKQELAPDARREIAKLLGKAWHAFIEQYAGDDIAEERLYATVLGKRLSGAMDLQHRLTDNTFAIRDWKLWKVAELLYDHHSAECQLNCYAFLCRENGKEVESLAVYALLKDWQEGKMRDPSYPRSPFHKIDIPLWPAEKAKAYVGDRMMQHFFTKPVTDCTKEERWLRGEAWALYKGDGKRAAVVYSNRLAAMEAWKKTPGSHIQHRPGDPLRCQRDWCEVARFCPQYLKELNIEDQKEAA